MQRHRREVRQVIRPHAEVPEDPDGREGGAELDLQVEEVQREALQLGEGWAARDELAPLPSPDRRWRMRGRRRP